MDRRIVKTRKQLQVALLDLLREKPLEAIEIQAITDRADTARVTFYRHYGTKEELLIDALEDIYQDMHDLLQVVSVEKLMNFDDVPPCQILFDYLERDRVLHKKLLTGSVSALIQQRLRHYIVQQVVLTLSASPYYANAPLGLIANHIASCLIGNALWWLAEDVPYSAAYIAQLSHSMALGGVQALMGQGEGWRLPSMA